MTNRNFIPVIIYLGVSLSCFTSPLTAMLDPEWTPIRMIIDAPIELEPLFPRIGHYATPYSYATPLVAISSSTLIDLMPENLTRAVGDIYKLSGSLDSIRTGLKKKLKERTLRISLVIWTSLPNPAHYNVVFHQIVGDWMGLRNPEPFNVNIPAGLFDPQGVRAGAESIPFNALGSLNVNRHDGDMYSPDNGRFYPEAGKDAVSFWVVGTHAGYTVISYNLMLLSTPAKKLFTDTVDVAQVLHERESINVLVNGLHSLEKVIRKDDQAALAGSIQALERMQITQIPVVVPAKKPVENKPAEIKRDAALAIDLALLNNNLRSLERAIKKEKPEVVTAAQQQAATEALLSEIEAREAQAEEDAALAASLSAGEVSA